MSDIIQVTSKMPVTFRMVIVCKDGHYHLFEMDYDELCMALPGLKLSSIPGVPNVVGPAGEFDNQICNIMYDGKSKRYMAQIYGYKCPSQIVDEIKKELPEWKYIRQLRSQEENDKDLFGI